MFANEKTGVRIVGWSRQRPGRNPRGCPPSRWSVLHRTGCRLLVLLAMAPLNGPAIGQQTKSPERAWRHPLAYINTSFANASPLYWEIDDQGTVNVFLVYDQERSSPNRANGHWHFQLQARPGSDLTLVLYNLDNVWNGKHGSPAKDATISFTSIDGRHWQPIDTELLDGDRLKLRIHMVQECLYVARLEPYRISDLESFKKSISPSPLVEIAAIGTTVDGRELEVIRVGNPAAPHSVLLRARAHPWEPGGNWVIEGLIKRLLEGDAKASDYLSHYCVYVLPMANKDGVARGRTRFNMQGSDLNRKWDKPADPRYAPENAALESWLGRMIAAGRRPDFAIDFHNDDSGRLHVSRPNIELRTYLKRMATFERLLRQHTWFTEGATGGTFRNPGTFGEGLLERFGITACIHELNANWIAGLNDYPSAKNWQRYGAQLCAVLNAYFQQL